MICKITRFYGILARVLILVLVLAASLPFPAPAVLAQDGRELLQEIEEHIKNYYLYPVEEEHFPLKSLEGLRRVLKDPYSGYLSEEQYRLFEGTLSRFLYGVGIYLEMRDSSITVVNVVPDSPARRAGIESGDLIIAVDGSPVTHLPLEEVVALIQGEEGKKVTLTLRRRETLLTVTLVREKIRLPAVDYIWAGDGIALVHIYNFGEGAAGDMELIMEELEREGLRGLILDLRANQGGYLNEALEMASLFSDGTLLLVRDKDTSWQAIHALEKGSGSYQSGGPYPTVVLINRGTASAAEIFSAALKDNRKALLVGEVSFGKGTMQSVLPLKHGGYLKLTVAEFASPQGNTIEGSGVEPHFLVPSGEEQLQTALWLLRYKLEQGAAENIFKEDGLPGAQESEGLSWTPLEIGGERYLPLRAVLFLTGRTIQPGAEPGIYIFFWENRLYRLDIQRKILIWSREGEKRSASQKVAISGGVTYVPQSFLEKELGLSF